VSEQLIRAKGLFIDPPGEIVSGALLVRDGLIAEVLPLPVSVETLGPEIILHDLDDCYLFPGLINTHVHLSFTASNDPLADYYAESPAARLSRAIDNAHTLLCSGVTTARDCGSDWTLLGLDTGGQVSSVPLPRLLMCGPPITTARGHLHMMGGEADGVIEIGNLVRKLHQEGATSIKVMATGGNMTPGTLPECASYSLEELAVARQTAAALGLSTAAHVLAGEGIRRAALAGFDSLEHCAFFVRTSQGWLERRFDQDIAELVSDSGAAVMVGLSAAYHLHDEARRQGATTLETRFYLAQERRLMEAFMRFFELGIPLICGTDAGVKVTPFDETYLELMLMVQAGLSPLEAIRSATVRAARALKLDQQIGRIREGYQADLIAVRGNPLVDVSVFGRVDWVMRSGDAVQVAR
jgi:imidazolonepropionase-like amidohydrolase